MPPRTSSMSLLTLEPTSESEPHSDCLSKCETVDVVHPAACVRPVWQPHRRALAMAEKRRWSVPRRGSETHSTAGSEPVRRELAVPLPCRSIGGRRKMNQTRALPRSGCNSMRSCRGTGGEPAPASAAGLTSRVRWRSDSEWPIRIRCIGRRGCFRQVRQARSR